MGWIDSETGKIRDGFKTPEQGASTSVWAAVGPELEGVGGLYLEDCNQGLPAEPTNRVSGFSAHIADPAAALRLWEVSEQLLAGV